VSTPTRPCRSTSSCECRSRTWPPPETLAAGARNCRRFVSSQADLGLAKGTVSKAYDELLRGGIAKSEGRNGNADRGPPRARRVASRSARTTAIPPRKQLAVTAHQLGRERESDARDWLRSTARVSQDRQVADNAFAIVPAFTFASSRSGRLAQKTHKPGCTRPCGDLVSSARSRSVDRSRSRVTRPCTRGDRHETPPNGFTSSWP